MKKIIVLVLGVVAFTMVSCDKNTPEEAVKEYYTHYFKGEFDQIQECVLEEHRVYYQILQGFVSEEDKQNAANLKVDIKDVKCEIVDDTLATCTCVIRVEDKQTSEVEENKEVIDLKKVGKKWLVDFGKENTMPSDTEMDDFDVDAEMSEPAELEEAMIDPVEEEPADEVAE